MTAKTHEKPAARAELLLCSFEVLFAITIIASETP